METPTLQLKRDEDPGEGLRRIVEAQIDLAIWHIDRPAPTPDDVHEYRRVCRRVRSAFLLVRTLDEAFFRHENTAFRDAARVLSPLRATYVMPGTIHRLVEGGIVDAGSAAVLEHYLAGAADAVGAQILSDVGTLTETMTDARRRVPAWELPSQLVPTTLGLERTYARGRAAMKKAYASPPSALLFHEWRKRVKYLQHQMEILSSSSSRVGKMADSLGELAHGLGWNQDLADLSAVVDGARFLFSSSRQQQRLAKVLQREQRSLLKGLRPVGEKMYAESPEALVERLTQDWESWRASC
jgi:CHAD domain-containing protein